MSIKDHDPAVPLSAWSGIVRVSEYAPFPPPELPQRSMDGSRAINSVVRDEMVRLPLEALGMGPAPGEPPVADITWGRVGLSPPSEGLTWRYAGWVLGGTAPVEEYFSREFPEAALEELYKEAGQPSAVAQARGVRSEPVEVGVQEQWGEEFER